MIFRNNAIKRIAAFISILIMFAFCACGAPATVLPHGESEAPLSSSPEPDSSAATLPTKATQPEQETQTPIPAATSPPYPFEDEDGRTRYRLIINGETVDTDNLPFSVSGEKGAYYPLEDTLAFFDVPCLINESSRAATGRVNGAVFKAQARVPEMTVGKVTLGPGSTPQYIDGCLYVPSYLFMELMDATVDFTSDRSGATLVTDITIDADKSSTDGLKLADHTFGDGSVRLTLEAQSQSVCAKLFPTEAIGKDDELLVVFIDPNERADLYFSAGAYVLKLASGNVWISDEEAFGESGSYSTTEAYTFEKGGQYELKTSAADGDFYSDSADGFTGN